MEIRNAQGNIILSETYDSDHPERYFVVADSSYHFQEIMGDNNIVLNFSLTYFVEFPIGSTINFQNTVYTMLSTAHFTKQNERQYDYTLTFESAQKELSRYKFRNMVDGRLNFTLTAQPQEFLEHIVWNMNDREGGTRWQVGEVVASAEKTQSFSHNYLLDALNQVAQLFETEWEIVGTTINLRKVEYNKNETQKNRLEYGRGNGFISGVSRQNSGEKAVDVLWVEGGDRNIDSQTYTYEKTIEGQEQTLHANKLRLPKGGTFYYVQPTEPTDKGKVYSVAELTEIASSMGMTYPDYVNMFMPQALIVNTDADGFGIHRREVDWINGGYEDSIDFTEIYPHKVLHCGTVELKGYTGDPTTTKVDEISNRFWDITASDTDGTIPNYNDCLIGGQEVTIIFNTGMLAGKEFNLAEQSINGKVGCFDPATKKFLIQPVAIDGITMPDLPIKYDDGVTYVQDKDGNYGTGYVPAIGDEFAVFHVSLPQQYIDEAERELLLEGCHYLWQHSEVEVEFSGTVDGIWAKNKWESLKEYLRLGGYINFYDNDFCRDGRMLRILSVKTYLNNPHSPELTLSNSTVSQSVSSELKKIPQNQVYTDYRVEGITSYARRSFRNAEETRDALQNWAQQVNNYFTSGISPVTVQTMQLLVGDKSLQYEFGVATTDSEDNVTAYDRRQWSPYYEDGILHLPTHFGADDAILRHRYYTAENGNEGIVKQFTDAEFPYWQFAANAHTEFTLEHQNNPYYLYIVAPKTAVTEHIGKVVDYADFELVEITDTTELPTDTPTHYYLLCGILNSEQGGTRSYTNVFGTVEITGGQMRLDEAISQDGDNYIDFINMIIKGDVNIVDGGIAKEFIFGTDRRNNYGGITGDAVYYGEHGDFFGRAVRMWIGNSSQLLKSGNQWNLFGANVVFFADGSVLFTNAGLYFYKDTTKSTWAMQTNTSFRVADIDSCQLFARQCVEVTPDITDANRVSSYIKPQSAQFVNNIFNVRTLLSRKYQGIVPTLIFNGRVFLERKNANIRWNASWTYSVWNKRYDGNVPTETYYAARYDSAQAKINAGSPEQGVALIGFGGWYENLSLYTAFAIATDRTTNRACRVWFRDDVQRPRYANEGASNWSFAVEVHDTQKYDCNFDLQIFCIANK